MWQYFGETEPPDYLLSHRQDSAQQFFLNYISELNDTVHGTVRPEEVAKEYASEFVNSAASSASPPQIHSVEEIQRAHFLVNSAGNHCGTRLPAVEIEFPSYMVDPCHLPRKPEPDEIVVLEVHPTKYSYNIERELPVLTKAEEAQYSKELEASMAKEWKSWNDYESFVPIRKSKAFNTIDARWVHKFKIVEGERVIKSRLCVRGFRDTQGFEVCTAASTATRWTQRLINSIAANNSWKVFTADVGSAFLQGMTFEELQELTGELLREVCFRPPAGSWKFLSKFDVCKGCSEATHTLKLVKGRVRA